MRLWYVSVIFLLWSSTQANNCPIVFVHGIKGTGLDQKTDTIESWLDWNASAYGTGENPKDYRTALDKIRIEGYGEYTPGHPFNCHKNTELTPTGSETTKIYNFSSTDQFLFFMVLNLLFIPACVTADRQSYLYKSIVSSP